MARYELLVFNGQADASAGFGIMLATQTAIECQLHTPRCSSAMFCVALALLTSIFCESHSHLMYAHLIAIQHVFVL